MLVVPQRLQQWHCTDLQAAPRCRSASQRSAIVAVIAALPVAATATVVGNVVPGGTTGRAVP